MGVVKGLYVTLTDIPYDSLGYCKSKQHPRSLIKFNSDVETRGRTTHRVFLFIMKAKIEFVCFNNRRKHNIHLYSREADSLPYKN